MRILFLFLAFVSIAMADPFHRRGSRDYVRTSLGDNIDISTMKFLKVAYDDATDKNIVSSPMGLMILLSLYNLGLGTAAGTEINNFLGGTDARQISNSFKELSVMFSEMNPDILSVANKISVSDQCDLNEIFAAEARDYRSEFDKLDFSNSEEAAAKINQWASEKTKGHITEPVDKNTLTPDVLVALFNVIYFNGHWHVPFKANQTKEKNFHVSQDSIVKKPMMHLLQSLMFYTESKYLGAKMIELPYQERGFRMVVVLPNEIDGLPSVLEKAAEKGLLSDVFNLSPVYEREIEIDIPKFDIKSKLDFKKILPKVGIRKIFEEPAAGIVKQELVKVSKALQEAFIKVNEEGSSAGAFTGVFLVPVAEYYPPPPPLKFNVDHPFLYLILYEDKILFAGTYAH